MDSTIQLRYARTEDGSVTERLPPPTITVTTASGSQVTSTIDVSTPAQEGVITTTDGVRRYNCTFRSKQDKKRLKRFRRLQKARGHR